MTAFKWEISGSAEESLSGLSVRLKTANTFITSACLVTHPRKHEAEENLRKAIELEPENSMYIWSWGSYIRAAQKQGAGAFHPGTRIRSRTEAAENHCGPPGRSCAVAPAEAAPGKAHGGILRSYSRTGNKESALFNARSQRSDLADPDLSLMQFSLCRRSSTLEATISSRMRTRTPHRRPHVQPLA